MAAHYWLRNVLGSNKSILIGIVENRLFLVPSQGEIKDSKVARRHLNRSVETLPAHGTYVRENGPQIKKEGKILIM